MLFQLRLTPVNLQSKMHVVCAYYDFLTDDNRRFARFNSTGYFGQENFKVIGREFNTDTFIELSKVKILAIKRLNNEEGNCGIELGINSTFGNGSGKLKAEYTILKKEMALFKYIISAIIQ